MTPERVTQQRVIAPPLATLRPQKRLFIVMGIAMLLWIGALLTMYFTTVWPQRHSPAPHEIDVDDHHPTTMTG